MDDIIAIIGIEAALKLCSMLGGNTIYIPKDKNTKRVLILSEHAMGMSIKSMSIKHGISGRQVLRLLSTDEKLHRNAE